MKRMNVLFVTIILGIPVIFITGFVSGTFISNTSVPSTNETISSEIRKSTGNLTSPLLECDVPLSRGGQEFSAFEKELSGRIHTLVNEGKVTKVSMYFRSLLGGAWFGINEKELFTPASLLKVPVMIAVYKLAESDPTLLSKRLTYTQVYSKGTPYFDSKEHLELGKEYTVEDIVFRMIKFSDNESMFLLGDKLGPHLVENLYTDLKIIPPNENISDDFMTIKDYSSFFRILFNATYLSPAFSNKALEILTSVEFNQGISAHLPQGIIAAHKFGERTYTDDQSKQLHDCGIIYYPNNPYLLCIMTKGKEFEQLASVIRDLSDTVLKEIQTRSKQN